MARYTTLFSLLVFSILSALAIRGILLTSELDGQKLLNVGIASLNLEYTVNKGINFGLASDESSSQQIKLAAFAVIICIAILFWGARSASRWGPIIAGLFAGGGLGNAIERILYDGVFDYLNISFIFYENPYSFNLADFYIFVAALLFIFPPSPN